MHDTLPYWRLYVYRTISKIFAHSFYAHTFIASKKNPAHQMQDAAAYGRDIYAHEELAAQCAGTNTFMSISGGALVCLAVGVGIYVTTKRNT